MNNLQITITNYLEYCTWQKRLDKKTLKAYRIDLKQFAAQIPIDEITEITASIIEEYISYLHKNYKPKTVKRKIAAIKAFFHFLEYKDIININPFNKLQIRFREPIILPKTIPLHTIETILSTLYKQLANSKTDLQKKYTLRDIAVIELLFATGIRVSELCSLKISDINLYDRNILIHGKGSKERRLLLCNDDVVTALVNYQYTFQQEIHNCGYFFVNQLGNRLSEQSVREIINKYTKIANISQHITPHMFRHSFATLLLEEDVDIRYIQEMLGHSSINITEIYTHVAMAKQKNILTSKHPRKNLNISK